MYQRFVSSPGKTMMCRTARIHMVLPREDLDKTSGVEEDFYPLRRRHPVTTVRNEILAATYLRAVLKSYHFCSLLYFT